MIHHSEGIDSGFIGLYVFGWTGFSVKKKMVFAFFSKPFVIVVNFLKLSA